MRAGRYTIEVNDPNGELKALWEKCQAKAQEKLAQRVAEAKKNFPELVFDAPESTNGNVLKDVLENYLKL